MNNEHLFRIVAMQRIGTTRRLAGTADIEAVRFADMHILMGILGHPRPNDGEIFLLVTTGATRIDERIRAWLKFGIANKACA